MEYHYNPIDTLLCYSEQYTMTVRYGILSLIDDSAKVYILNDFLLTQ